MQEKYEVCLGLLHGFDWSAWTSGTPTERLSLLPAAQEHILAQESGKDRYLAAVRALSQAFALAVPHEETHRIRDDVGFFQAVRAPSQSAPRRKRAPEDLDLACARSSRGCGLRRRHGLFAAAGLEKARHLRALDSPRQFGMPHRNLAVSCSRSC